MMTLMLMSLLLQDVTNSNRYHIAMTRLHCKIRQLISIQAKNNHVSVNNA